MQLLGKAAIVTGGAGRIGKGVALALAAEGAKVVVSDYGVDPDGTNKSSQPSEEVAAEIRSHGGQAVACSESVAEVSGVQNIVKTCVDAYGVVDILVNTAGIFYNKLVIETPDEMWDRVMGVHARGMFLCSKYAALQMTKRHRGRIINFVSLAGLEAYPGVAAYAMAKAGILNLTWTLAQELASYDITVNAVAPKVLTPRRKSATSIGAVPVPESVREIRRAFGVVAASDTSAPAQEMRAEPVGALVAYLASDEAQYINGQVIGIEHNRLDVWTRPSIGKTIFSEEAWTLPTLQKHFRSTAGLGMSNRKPPLNT